MASATADDARMSFLEHLEELRSRVFRAALGVIAGVIVCWNFRELLLGWMVRPLEIASYCRVRGCTTRLFIWFTAHPRQFSDRFDHIPVAARPSLHFAGPTDAFVAYLKLSFIAGLVFALPVIFYQLWSFVAPGLYPREKKLVLPFVFFSTLFFVAGSLFGYYLVFPIGYEWFLSFGGRVAGTHTTIVDTIMMEDYLSFTSQMLLAFGVVFELPLFIFFLALAGIVSGIQLFKFGRYFTVIAFVVAAVLTPSTDVYSQVMLAAPLVLLYFLAAALSLVFGPKEGRGIRSGMKSAKPDPKEQAPSRPAVAAAGPAMSAEEAARRAKIVAAKGAMGIQVNENPDPGPQDPAEAKAIAAKAAAARLAAMKGTGFKP